MPTTFVCFSQHTVDDTDESASLHLPNTAFSSHFAQLHRFPCCTPFYFFPLEIQSIKLRLGRAFCVRFSLADTPLM